MADLALESVLLPGLPVDLIRVAYAAAPGNELGSGKFFSPESSACLAANVFGGFLNRPTELPPLPGTAEFGWPAKSFNLETVVRFPWRGGRHPCPDALVETGTALIGIEAKRYEPFRAKDDPDLSDAYWRPVWGEAMGRYQQIRDELRDGRDGYECLDAAQLVKHAFGLRSAIHRRGSQLGKRSVLVYLYAEPQRWEGGQGAEVSRSKIDAHRAEIARFAAAVDGDEVIFRALTYRDLLIGWRTSASAWLRDYASALLARFDI